jgi:hypothetical protein
MRAHPYTRKEKIILGDVTSGARRKEETILGGVGSGARRAHACVYPENSEKITEKDAITGV